MLALGKVLIIDDDADIRSFLSILFEGWSFEVATAENGMDGIMLALDFEPTLILLDLNMRGMTGFETARRIRAESKIASTPILAVTGLGKAEDRDEAHLAGCDAVVSKPIDASVLYQAMSRLIGKMHQ